jgi:hypothetical protein
MTQERTSDGGLDQAEATVFDTKFSELCELLVPW